MYGFVLSLFYYRTLLIVLMGLQGHYVPMIQHNGIIGIINATRL